jgi:hypothetical protein
MWCLFWYITLVVYVCWVRALVGGKLVKLAWGWWIFVRLLPWWTIWHHSTDVMTSRFAKDEKVHRYRSRIYASLTAALYVRRNRNCVVRETKPQLRRSFTRPHIWLCVQSQNKKFQQWISNQRTRYGKSSTDPNRGYCDVIVGKSWVLARTFKEQTNKQWLGVVPNLLPYVCLLKTLNIASSHSYTPRTSRFAEFFITFTSKLMKPLIQEVQLLSKISSECWERATHELALELRSISLRHDRTNQFNLHREFCFLSSVGGQFSRVLESSSWVKREWVRESTCWKF